MEMTSTRIVNAPPDEVWAALNDPAVLKDAIPGCETLERTTDTDWKVVVAAKVGPVILESFGQNRHLKSGGKSRGDRSGFSTKVMTNWPTTQSKVPSGNVNAAASITVNSLT